MIENDLLACSAMLVTALLAAWLCTGSLARRLFALLVGLSLLLPPWVAAPSIVRGVLCLVAAILVMRLLELLRDPGWAPTRRVWHVISPVDSRLLQRVPRSVDGRAFGVAFLWLVAVSAGLWIAAGSHPLASTGAWLLRWLGGLIAVYGFVEALWSGTRGIYSLLGFKTPLLHRHPSASRTVRELWGDRWSRPISGWLELNVFKPCARLGHPQAGLVAAFFASAVLHAYTVFVCVGAVMAWTMLAYFMVQGLLVLAERGLGVRGWHRVAAHAWVIGVMLLTSPLFIEPFLRAVGIDPV